MSNNSLIQPICLSDGTAITGAAPLPIAFPDPVGIDVAMDSGASDGSTIRTISATNDPAVLTLGFVKTAVESALTTPPVVEFGGGVSTAATQRVMTANNSPEVTSLAAIKTAVEGTLDVASADHRAVALVASRNIVVTSSADVVIAASDRVFLAIQMQSPVGSLRVTRAASTATGTVGQLLNPAPAVDCGGGYWESTGVGVWRGPVALRAFGAVSVSANIEEY
jgi:hypothetical protein